MIMGSWCTIYNKFLIGWVAVEYHWISDESVQYLGESEDILNRSARQTKLNFDFS